MIGWRDGAGALHRGSLFGAFAALARGNAWSFPALRPHQREAWHAFTVQVAALALIRSGSDAIPTEEAAWRDLLLALTPGQPEAWELVVDDWSKPALLQPPVLQHQDLRAVETPDLLDMLLTAKNHDVKRKRIFSGTDEEWLFALITLQTAEGDRGISPPKSRYFGISRMNKGFGSRFTLGVRADKGAGGDFIRDTNTLVSDANSRPDRRNGLRLLWLDPWDGISSLNFTKLDELYIEICRIVRLQRSEDGIVAMASASQSARIAAAALKGNTGDPWAPMKRGKPESVGVSSKGLGYRKMADLLDYRQTSRPLLAQLHPSDPNDGLSIVAAAFARGQGKTEGLHRRTVRTGQIEALANGFGRAKALDRVGDVASRRASDAGTAAKILTRALSQLVQGGPTDIDVRGDDKSTKTKVEPWRESFDALVDSHFFEDDFWREAQRTDGESAHPWRSRLAEIARDVFERAVESGPRTEMRRLQAWARARNYLDHWLDKWVEESADDKR